MMTPGLSESGMQKEAQVQKVQKLEAPQFPSLGAPHYSDSSSVFTDEYSYRSLSHCLRSNIFPGPPVEWSTLAKDSYISHSLQSLTPDPQHWYGRRTDDMMRWTERNIINQKLEKALKELDQKDVAK
ncbi:testis-expressed protein 33 [Astyanax mexicanus]|uniref:testis-expressed protein 33 n=1 Tax=Astyanax mexicanus TaxID=7994 RepID=UPI000BBD6FD5|nr:testis-expressed protein 33 [Astyanax mexicanus]